MQLWDWMKRESTWCLVVKLKEPQLRCQLRCQVMSSFDQWNLLIHYSENYFLVIQCWNTVRNVLSILRQFVGIALCNNRLNQFANRILCSPKWFCVFGRCWQERMKGVESESPIHGPLPMKIIWSLFWFCVILQGYFKDDTSFISKNEVM